MPAADSVAAEEWDYLGIDVLRPARSSRVGIACQHFRYEVGRHCITVLTCPIHQGLIPQGEHLTKHCARREVGVERSVSAISGLERTLVFCVPDLPADDGY